MHLALPVLQGVLCSFSQTLWDYTASLPYSHFVPLFKETSVVGSDA